MAEEVEITSWRIMREKYDSGVTVKTSNGKTVIKWNEPVTEYINPLRVSN